MVRLREEVFSVNPTSLSIEKDQKITFRSNNDSIESKGRPNIGCFLGTPSVQFNSPAEPPDYSGQTTTEQEH